MPFDVTHTHTRTRPATTANAPSCALPHLPPAPPTTHHHLVGRSPPSNLAALHPTQYQHRPPC
eukprot:3086987-Prymnesium_polylepis.1